ncbi:hypothetical protein SAMN05880574_1031 [Chryseobacterium sp. RU37D]|nr:hypothetical protein SAMN05880574_1031 [Chryseobacterium sp. RU37D]
MFLNTATESLPEIIDFIVDQFPLLLRKLSEYEVSFLIHASLPILTFVTFNLSIYLILPILFVSLSISNSPNLDILI